jgi:predicted ABC-type ATPase
MLERMLELVRNGASFAFETTCSGKSYLRLVKEWQALGWRISLLYLWLPTPEHSVLRVAQRVRSGGHGIPEKTIRRRYLAGLQNVVELYMPLADAARIYDKEHGSMKLVAEKDYSGQLVIHDGRTWKRIQEQRHEASEPAGDI